LFYNLVRAAAAARDEDTFIASLGCQAWMDDLYNGDTDRIVRDLRHIYEVANWSVRDLRKRAGLSQGKFADRFAIPLRTVVEWDGGRRSCVGYMRLMMAELLGLIRLDLDA
jgi:hypothetical protein